MDTQSVQSRGGEREGVSDKAWSMKSQSKNTDWLVYLATCQIGHTVEAHVKNGSVYSGIFHAVDIKEGSGIILKMARLIKDGTLRGNKSPYEIARKRPLGTFIIHADELVQVVAKDLSVSSDSILNTIQSEKPTELLTDSSISKSHHGDVGKELEPWVPDEDFPPLPNKDVVLDSSRNREAWNQFEENEKKFGVKSTYNEELYTTKLKRDPRVKGLEEQAQRIAREIECENTRDLHVAEERGHQLKFDIDEETKYASVCPVDDSGCNEEDNTLLDTCNDQTFGGASTSDRQKPASSSKGNERLLGDSQSSQDDTNVDPTCSISDDHTRHPPSEQRSKEFASTQSTEESVSGHGDNAKSGGGATSASKTTAEREGQVSEVSGKTKSESSLGQSASKNSESHPAPSTSSRPGPSPSSSTRSLSSSENSTLNPDAKEFKLNPKAKSLKPLQAVVATPPRSSNPEVSFYWPPAPPVQQMPGMPPVGYGMAQQYPHPPPQQMVYPYPQTYYPPYGPVAQYQQQQQQQHQMMIHNEPPPHAYIPPPPHPPYQQEMPWNNEGQE